MRRPPELVVVGAMKCGTSALHGYLDAHPEIAMAPEKEVNFFFGPAERPDTDPDTWWVDGQWHRGTAWYVGRFDPAAPLRGEASPGYTDPAHPEVPARMARVAPHARLVYLVRDPVDRAVSQWRHHRRDGTEPRVLAAAVLDPASQYLDRSRYHARIAGFLAHFERDQLLVVAQEDLLRDRRATLRRVFEHVGADPAYWDARLDAGPREPRTDPVPDALRAAVWAEVGADADRLAELVGADLLRR
ncbi:sulfotransferase family protein [Nocardioides pantholopis]|uniref:sulfotransferase family protein n=1 Tax=Nocardioides pantholopis TaxID=2483798 RepID=UPI000FDAA612|nr:sulfotransferase [Nocardioides pantholopis]